MVYLQKNHSALYRSRHIVGFQNANGALQGACTRIGSWERGQVIHRLHKLVFPLAPSLFSPDPVFAIELPPNKKCAAKVLRTEKHTAPLAATQVFVCPNENTKTGECVFTERQKHILVLTDNIDLCGTSYCIRTVGKMQDNFRGVTVRSFRRESSCPRRGTSLPLRRRQRTTSRCVSLSPRGRPDGSSPPFGRGMSHPYGTGAELLLRGGMFYLSSAEMLVCQS